MAKDGKPELLPADLAGAAVPLTGFVGPSVGKDRVRIYTSMAFDEYYDIAQGDILHVSASADSLAPSILWIRREAALSRIRAGNVSHFLTGDIVGDHLGGSLPQDTEVARWTTILRTVSRLFCRTRSLCGPCSVPSICNKCLPIG